MNGLLQAKTILVCSVRFSTKGANLTAILCVVTLPATELLIGTKFASLPTEKENLVQVDINFFRIDNVIVKAE